MGLLKSKLMLRLTLAVSVFGVAVGAVSTAAWFQINTSANNIDQATQTRNLATTATVYQDNNHANDDPYQITPTPDNGVTLSYDHSKGGKATNYYIRFYDNEGEIGSPIQMFSNINNNADKAVYYNIAFDENFKIYNASTDAYLGYSNIDSNCQIKGTQFEAQSDDQNDTGRDNIHCLTSNYYDIYVTVDNSGNDRIWIGAHSEVTTSAEMGNETGYYIYGTNADSYSSLAGHNDIKNGIAMYVNAAADTHDLAFYAGLRLSVGDTFYLVSGDSTEPYKEATNDGLLNPEGGNSDNFNFDLETGLITCRVLGYYCIALNQDSKIHMTTWDGMEVDGTTRYTVNNMADQSAQKNNVEKKARRNATETTGSGYNKIYLWLGNTAKNIGSDGWATANATIWLYVFDSNSHEAGLQMHYLSGSGADAIWNCDISSLTWEPTTIIFVRRANGISTWGWSDKWAQTGNITFETSGNYYKLTGESSGEFNTADPLFGTDSDNYYITNQLYAYSTISTGTYQGTFAINSGTGYNLTFAKDNTLKVYNRECKKIFGFLDFTVTDTWCDATDRITQPVSDLFTVDGSKNCKASKALNCTFTFTYTNSTTFSYTFSAFKTTVTLNKQSGEGGSSSVTATYGSGMPSATMPSRVGYTFGGYFTETNGGGTKYYNANGSSAKNWNFTDTTKTLFAKWSINSHSLSWNFNGGEATTSYTAAGTYNYGTAITKPTLSKPGYSFSGWSSSATTMPDSDLTLTASWTAKTFNIVFNNNGGSGSITKMSNAQIGTTLSSNNGSMTNGNRAFLGWSLNSGDSLPTIEDGAELTGTNADALYAAKDGNNDATLFAIWGEVHTVTLEVAATPSGETAPGTLSSYELANVPEGTSITIGTGDNKNKITIGSTTITATPKAQTAQYSYAFDSWTVEDDATSVTGDLTITAIFTETLRKYTVTLSRNDTGWGTLSSYSVANVPYNSTYLVSGNNMLIKNPSGTLIETITPTPTGATAQYTYGYGSWSSSSGTITGATALTYTFTRETNQYTVTINRNNDDYGTISHTSVTVDYNTAITINSNQITIGATTITATPADQTAIYTYTFSNWTKSPNNSSVTSAMTITANFEQNYRQYTISYSGVNGATVSPANPTNYTYNSGNITLTQPSKNGYTFDGWTGSNGEVKQKSVTIPANSTGNKSYTANWTAIEYTITYNGVNGATVSPANPTTYTIETNTITLSNPSKDGGFAFTGWSGSGSGLSVTIPKGSTGNKTFTANWDRTDGWYIVKIVDSSYDSMDFIASGGYDASNAAKFEGISITSGDQWKIAYYHQGDGGTIRNDEWKNNGFNSNSTHFGHSWSEAYASNNIICSSTGTYKIYLDNSSYKVSVNRDVTITYYEKKDGVLSSSNTATGNTDILLSTTLDGVFGTYSGYRIAGYYSNSACSSEMNINSLKPTPTSNTTVYALYEELPSAYLIGSFNNWNQNDHTYRLIIDPSNNNQVYSESPIVLAKDDQFKILYEGVMYGYGCGKPGDSEHHNALYDDKIGSVSDGYSGQNFLVKRTATYNFWVATNGTWTADAAWIVLVDEATLTYTTSKKSGATETQVYSSGDNGYYYFEGMTISAPALPTSRVFGYDLATEWNTNKAGTGASYDVGDTITFGASNISLWAIDETSDKYTYYFDIWSIKDSNTLTNDIHVHVWADGASGYQDIAASKINNSYNYYWQVDIPYSADANDLNIQVYRGDAGHSNKQSSSAKLSGSSLTIDGNVYMVSSWTEGTNGDGSISGSWLGTASNGTIQTVTFYVTKDNRPGSGSLANEENPEEVFTVLNQESWTMPAINTIFGDITGYTTPTNVHETTNTGTIRSAGDNIAYVTSNYTYYGVYTLVLYTFRICQSDNIDNANPSAIYTAMDGKTATYNVYNDTGAKTITGVHFEQGKMWYVDSNLTGSYAGTIMYSGINLTSNQIGISISGVTTLTSAIGNYFFKPSYSNNARTKIGGTYSVTIDVASSIITAITLTAIDLSDFIIVGKGGAFGSQNHDFYFNEAFEATSATGNGATIDFSYGNKHIWINDQMKSVRPYDSYDTNQSKDVHEFSNTYSGDSNGFFYIDGNTNIRCKVDLNATFTVQFNVSDGTFGIVLSSVVETICTKITFTHTEEAGIYLETTTNYTTVNQTKVADWTGSTTRIMMHTTSATIDGHTCYAQEAPIYTAGTAENPVFMRIVVTHSNYFTEVPSGVNKEERTKYLTEFYYVALDNDLRSLGFDSSTPTANDYDYDFEQGKEHEDFHGNGPGAYIVATVGGTWTITYRDDGKVHIEEFTGAATVSTEHEVPYYLIGRGMPGSALRECDFTTAKGINLWTYGGNNSTMPCYVGAYGGNTSSSNVVGSGVHLKKGDKFALASVSKQMLTFASATASDVSGHFTIDNTHKIVTINDSGLYRIYLSGSVGSEQINIEWVSADAESSRNESIISRNGISPISSTGNTLTLGGNLDYSLLDATAATGYSFVVQLDHVSTGASGDMDYKITNGNTYAIKVEKKNGTNASAAEYSSPQPINASSNYAYTGVNTRTITALTTTSTCIRVTIPASEIKSMISSGVYTFSITISYKFMEATIS